MAAAVRTLLRRRAAAPPSLALLQPLFPGLLKPTNAIQPRSPILGAAAGLPDARRPQLSPAPAPPLLRYYSSKGYVSPPQRQPPNSSKEMPRLELEEDVEFLIGGLQENLEKHTRNLVGAQSICNKKANALFNEGWDNKTVAMFEDGLEKVFEALADREKALDDIKGALHSSNALSTDTLQKFEMFHKKKLDDNKFIRQELNEVQKLFVAMKIRKKVNRRDLPISLLGQKKPNELSKFKGTAVTFGLCFALSVMINVTFLYSSHI